MNRVRRRVFLRVTAKFHAVDGRWVYMTGYGSEIAYGFGLWHLIGTGLSDCHAGSRGKRALPS